MDFPFMPTLQHMCIVKIALRLYYDSDIQMLRDESEDLPVSSSQGIWFCPPCHEHWKEIENLALQKLHFLPVFLRKKVVSLLRSTALQIENWKEKHTSIHEGYVPWENFLIWKIDGTIDFEQTARKISQNMNFHPKFRHFIASMYILEDEITKLWNSDRDVFNCTDGTLAASDFWDLYFLDGHNPWPEYVDFDMFRTVTWNRVSCIFRFLPVNERSYYTRYLCFPNSDDLYCSLIQINKQERLQLFQYDPHMLSSLLQWPLQVYFIDMAKILYSHMTVIHFERTLRCILDNCILNGLRDFDYFKLLKEFWELSPSSLKKEIEIKPIFKAIMITLNYNSDTEALFLEEVMGESRQTFWLYKNYLV